MVDKNQVFSSRNVSFFISIFFIFFLILLVPLTSATFSVGNLSKSLEKVYGPSDNITGWVNVSFSSEPLSSVFSDSKGNSANLSKVLKNNAVYSYSCSPLDCKDDYSADSSAQTKSATLNAGESKVYGVKLTGNIFKIESFKFTIDSNAPASCTNQLEVDFLDDSVLDARNKNAVDSASCSNKDYGCFDSGKQAEEPVIDSIPFCEKVTLSDSPGFLIGAWIKKVSGSRNISAYVYKTNGEQVANCILPDSTSAGGEVSCSVAYSVTKPAEHYVCIKSTSGSGDYRIKGYSATNSCGFHATPIPSSTPAAYQIFAQGKQFGPVGTFSINKSSNDGKSFAKMAEDYLISRNGGFNCSAGCVIPIKISSNANQAVTIRDLQINYEKDLGVVVENNLYDISRLPAKISSGFQKLYLDNSGFSVPSGFGNYTFSLKFNTQDVISEKVEVKDVPIIRAVSPLKAAAAYPTEFRASVDSKYNVTKFSWNFGDNTSEVTTTGNKTIHAYNSTGIYNLRVKVTDQRQLSSTKVFVINVTSPKDLINLTLSEKEKDVSNLEKEISLLSPVYQEAINSSLNLSYVKQRLGLLKTNYQSATSETQYNSIVTELVGLNIPESISKSKSAGNVLLFSKASYVNLPALKEIGGGTYDASKEESYINAVLLWQQENLNINFDFNEFSGRYQGHIEPVTRIFEMKIDEKKDIANDYYLILPELEGFTTDEQFRTEPGYIYINLKGKNSVSFSTTENVDFANLPAFVSPAISRLVVAGETLPEEKNTSKWILFSVALFFLIVIGFIIYIIMQEWYKRRYENYLFKNRNDLYNMANYINNAKRKGLKNDDIEANLKRVGWSAEKIRYAMRKYAGKRTGMFELIPIRKLAENIGRPNNPKGGFQPHKI